MTLGPECVHNQLHSAVESNVMDCAKSSEAQERCVNGDTQREILETSSQSTSISEDSKTDEETMRRMDTNDSGPEETESKLGRVPVESNNEDPGHALVERSQTESIPTVDSLADLDSIYGALMKIISLYGGQIEARELLILGVSEYEQFRRTGVVEDLDRAIEYWGVAIILSPTSQADLSGLLNNLGCAYWSRFEHLGRISDLSKAIEFGAKAVSLTPDGIPDKPGYLSSLGNSYSSRFDHLGELPDLDKAIEVQGLAVSLAPDGYPGKAKYLNNLGSSYSTRFGRLGELLDMNKAIELKAEAVFLTPEDHPDRPAILHNLGISYRNRFDRLGELSDLNKAIESQTQAVSLTPDGHPGRPGYLSSLGNTYRTRSERLGGLSDLNKAIEYQALAVSLTPDGYPGRPGLLSNLANSYGARFDHLGELSDLNKSAELKAQVVALTPDGHPDKPRILSDLGRLYETRFECLSELSDLNNAMESQAKAVLLTPDGHPEKPGRLDGLGSIYHTQFDRLGELSDLSKAIGFQSQAVSLTPDGHPAKPGYFNNLGASYETQFRRLGKLSDLNKAIEYKEQAVLLTHDSHPSKQLYLTNLGSSYETRFGRMGELSDLTQSIALKAKAVALIPDGHPGQARGLNNLGSSYRTRFERLGQLLDMSRAIEYQTRAVALTPDGHSVKPLYLNNLGNSYRIQFGRLGELSDLNKAIEFQAQAVLLSPNGHPEKPAYLVNLGSSYWARFDRLGSLLDLNKAIELKAQAVAVTSDDHPDKPGMLSNLGVSYRTRFDRLGERSDLDNAIESGAQAVSLIPDGHSNKPAMLTNLGCAYDTRFRHLGQFSDSSDAIEFGAKAVSLTPDGHPKKPGYLGNLGVSYETRFRRLGKRSDLQSAELSFRTASQSPTGPPSVRFHACKMWVRLSSGDTMLPRLPAYQQGISLIPQLVWIGTTVGRRYELVAEVSRFATEAASYAISTGAYELALEWLEAGRSIVWGQISQLRTPFEYLSSHHPKLAEELASVGRQLEHAGSRTDAPPSPGPTEPDLGLEARTHISLALKWDSLLEEVRSMSGFEDFLRSPTAVQLRSAAKVHPIAIINLHESRCDALILQPNYDTISHVVLPRFSPEDAILARRRVFCQVRARRPRPRLDPLGFAQSPLESLWSGVIEPVLGFLGYTHEMPVDQLPHLTWCTSGLLSFLPLHAARSQDDSQPSTFDLVISSYTPTLSALLSSQSAEPSSACGILAVGQENTPGLASLPCITGELAAIHKHTRSESYLQLEDGEATVEQVLDAMDQFSWVHMACHGSQDADDPTKSAFHLHDGDLTLAAITKRSFTNKGLAFLSACQTATGDEKMPDEAVHLAAGMLIAGYPSVIGTMWSIADEDGPEVANLVYAELLKDGKMDHTNSARALHQAVGHLRQKVGERDIARWAPFIHIGS